MLNYLRWLLLFSLLCATEPCLAQTRQTIWSREILAQPFDKQPFREIRIPEWVQGTTGVGYTLSVKPREERERAVKPGPQRRSLLARLLRR